MATPLPKLKKGSFPSLIDTATANAVIQAVEDLRNTKIVPQGYGKVVVADSGVTINLSGLVDVLKKQLANAESQTGNDPRVGALITAFNALIRAINSASISASCSPGGAITVTLTIPGVPAPL